jgi:5'-nucleotidase
MKRSYPHPAGAVAILAMMVLLPGIVWAGNQNFTILHLNDFHSHLLGFSPVLDYSPGVNGDDSTSGGAARIEAVIRAIRAAKAKSGEPVYLFDAGDFMMGTMFELLRGQIEFDFFRAIGVDVMTLGNHEFDWGPAQTATILSFAGNIPLVNANTVFSDKPDDDALAALYGDYGSGRPVTPYTIIERDNGLKIGVFGLMGKDAAEVAPFAAPVSFGDPVTAAQQVVAELKEHGVNVIIALSHSGLSADSAKSEDVILATKIPEIDVIVSGHTHTALPQPMTIGKTIIVQADSYGKCLGKLEVSTGLAGLTVRSYELVPIDDTIKVPSTQDSVTPLIETAVTEINHKFFEPRGYQAYTPLAETKYDLLIPTAEANLGNLITDAMRWMVDRYDDGKVDFAFESNGVIRDEIKMGDSGLITAADAFTTLPLGSGPDKEVGYPMMSFYVNAHEIESGCEVLATLYPMKGSNYFLQVSGLRFEYDMNRPPFFRVTKVYEGNEAEGYTVLDTSRTNRKLYKIAINYYVGQFMALVGDFTYGLIKIVPKDKDGNPIVDLKTALIDKDPATPGIQELKEWEGFFEYLRQLPDLSQPANAIPDIPALYSGPTGRIRDVTGHSCGQSAILGLDSALLGRALYIFSLMLLPLPLLIRAKKRVR